jgi:hypothetical protein
MEETLKHNTCRAEASYQRPLSGTSAEAATDRSWPNSDRIQRPLSRPTSLHLGLLRHFKRIINFDAKIADGTF